MDTTKKPGIARRMAVGTGKAWAFSLGFSGLAEELRRLAGGVTAAGRYVRAKLADGPQNYRRETFAEAVERLGLDEAHLLRQGRAFERRAIAWWMAFVLATCWMVLYLPFAERPGLFFLGCIGVVAMTFGNFLRWRFRYCQVRDRELYSFWPWFLNPRRW